MTNTILIIMAIFDLAASVLAAVDAAAGLLPLGVAIADDGDSRRI